MERKTLTQLFIPISFEILFYILAGMVDTLMLSYVGDDAVGAIGTANTYISMFIMMFSIISSGMIAVMTQYIGAKRPGVAFQARQLALVFNALLGIVLSIGLFFYAEPIISAVGISGGLMKYASVYVKIVGGACILNAIIPIFASYLRAFGETKYPLMATVIGNIINFILNAVFLFVFKLGVPGVAIATVISRLVNLIIVMIACRVKVKSKEYTERESGKLLFKQIIKIGFPSALEIILYDVSITFITRFLNQMDSEGINITARSYAVQITNFSFCVGEALAQANAIMTGWRIGAKKYKECEQGTKKAAIMGVIVAVILESLFAIFSGFIMRIFSDDPEIISIVGKLLAIDIVLEMGRVTNLVYGIALKTSGDAIFPPIIAAVFMFLWGVGGTYFFGIHLGLLVIGAYIGMAMDECTRAVFMVARWKSGIWKKKGFINKEVDESAV